MDAFHIWSHIPEKMFDVSLTQEEQAELDEFLLSIKEVRHHSSSQKVLLYDDFLIFNLKAKRKPIFWCFNNWAEPYLLAYQLTKDQPLIAAHSLNTFKKGILKKARYTEPLARRYLDSMVKLFGTQEFIIGGNCQAAPIAESFAIQLSHEFGIFQNLITIDYIVKRQYQGPILMLFGDESSHNPFMHGKNPIPYWQERLNSFRWKSLTGAHGTYFREPAISALKEILLGFS